MTLIAAVNTDDGVMMGADSAYNYGEEMCSLDDGKLVVVSGEMVLGVAGSIRHKNLLDVINWKKLVHVEGATNYQHVLGTVGAIRTLFREHGCIATDKNEPSREDWGGELLIGYRTKIYTVGSNFGVATVQRGYEAIGSGRSVALGAMHALHEGTSPFMMLKAAYEACRELTPQYVNGPWMVQPVGVIEKATP